MGKSEILQDLITSISEGDQDKAQKGAREALKTKMDPLEAVEHGLSKGMDIIGERFERGEAYLPELLMAADAFGAAMEILKPEVEAQKKEMGKAGTVVIGTVKGDLHHIGKNIVALVLETRGFSVLDLGVDIPPMNFIEEAEKAKAHVIALSALLTTTLPAQREVIEILKQKNLRSKYAVVVGGGPVTPQWADEIGADGYGKNAIDAAEMIKTILRKRR